MANNGFISDLAPLLCVLSSTDSTLVACWLHMSLFMDSHIYSQWVAGSDNGVAGALSHLAPRRKGLESPESG